MEFSATLKVSKNAAIKGVTFKESDQIATFSSQDP